MLESPESRRAMKAVTDLRATIDSFAARYAAGQIAQGASSRPLLVAFSRLQKAVQTGDPRTVAEADLDLHYAIVDLARVPTLETAWMAAAQAMGVFHGETIRTCWPDLNVLLEAHRPIVDAICAADEIAAEGAARSHLDAVWYRLAEMQEDASLLDSPLARARTYLAFNFQEPVRLRFLARYIAKTSVGHLSRLFQQEHGTTFTEYLRRLRMQKAVTLLTHSALSVAQIATRVGYEDGSRFARHFRQRFGVTPREYRQRFSPRSQ